MVSNSLRAVLMAAALVLGLVVAGPVRADEKGNAVLAKVDKALDGWKTLDSHYRITTKSSTGTSVLELRNRMKNMSGYNKQFIEISRPPDMAGTKVLTSSPTQMYIYLPSFKKIRRIASHMNEQGFLGTALSSADLNLTRYGNLYDAMQLGELGEEQKLKLTPKKDAKAPYPRIDLKIDKSRWVPVEIRYYGEGDRLLKVETRSNYVCESNHCVARQMVMKDLDKQVMSKLDLTEFRINPKLDDDLFSKRNLK